MSIFFNYNGTLFPAGTAVITPDSRGLRYGDGIFETMKVINGEVIFITDHFERLYKGLATLQFTASPQLALEKIENEILELVTKNGCCDSARVRLTITRGKGSLYDFNIDDIDYIIQAWPLEIDIGNPAPGRGISIGIYKDMTKRVDILSNIKHNNYLLSVLTALAAKENGWDDIVLLNEFGRVCETSIANIFLVKGREIVTPSLAEGCIDGVYRKNLIRVLKQSPINIVEKEVQLEELLCADEAFITNSVSGIRWVSCIGGKEYSNKTIRQIFNFL